MSKTCKDWGGQCWRLAVLALVQHGSMLQFGYGLVSGLFINALLLKLLGFRAPVSSNGISLDEKHPGWSFRPCWA